jgi:ribosome production factor 2
MAPTQRQAKENRAKQLSGGKAPKARVARYLKSTASKLKEGGKSTLLLKGQKCSAEMGQVLQELRAIKAPSSKLLSKKNMINAFDMEGQQSLEFLTTKNDCALVAMASHNKKRPNNLVLCRTFDRQMLDVAELGVLRFKSMADYGGSVPKKRIGSKPLMLFVGDLWQQSLEHRNLQNLLTDFYRGDVVDKVVVSGFDHLIVFALAAEDSNTERVLLHQRTYFCKLKKNPEGSSTPVPSLEPCGPDMDYAVRRTQWAPTELYRASRQQPKALKKKKIKNQTTNMFGEKIGRLHLEKQDVDNMQGRKSKALRRADKISAAEEKDALEQELGQEKDTIGKEFQQTFGFEKQETMNSVSRSISRKKKRTKSSLE